MLSIAPNLSAPSPNTVTARRQATLGGAFERLGRGLHTGQRARVRVSPAPTGHGIVFRRRMRNGCCIDIPALWQRQQTQPACTALRCDGAMVRTVEHLMASLYALRIDNALIETDAEELPIFDGSALPWCEGIAESGRREQDERALTLRVLRVVSVTDRHRHLSIGPGRDLTICAHIALRHIGAFNWQGPIDAMRFSRDIAPSRSFGRLMRVMAGRAYGLIAQKPLLQGCGPHSAALLFRDRVIGGLRMEDELVRHRVMDIVGDLALIGHPVEGRVIASHTCHDLNHALVAALMRDRTAWELV